MKKALLYGAVLAAVLCVPVKRNELGKLKPVESILLSKEKGQVTIETNTGDLGRGDTVEKALEDLKETASGVVYLDTADYLLLGPGGEACVEGIREYLKKGTRVCRAGSGIDVSKVTAYLDVHEPERELKEWKTGDPLQVLKTENDRMKLEEKEMKKDEKSP